MGTKFKNPLHSGKHRNKPCICASGKKTKNCHGRNSSLSAEEKDELNSFFTSPTQPKPDDSITASVEATQKELENAENPN